jgi:hypothetical protein
MDTINNLVETENFDLEIKSLDKTIYAQELIVDNNTKYLEAGEFIKSLKSLEDEICEAYDPSIDLAHKTHKSLLAVKKKYLDPVVTAKTLVTKKCLEYRRIENEKRIEAERQMQEQAKAEALRITERLREEERLAALANATANLASGNSDQPVEDLSIQSGTPEEVPVVAPIVRAEPIPEIQGLAVRHDWDFVIEDASLVPEQYKIIDEKKIRGVVKALKDQASIPGVRVFRRENLMNRGK